MTHYQDTCLPTYKPRSTKALPNTCRWSWTEWQW